MIIAASPEDFASRDDDKFDRGSPVSVFQLFSFAKNSFLIERSGWRIMPN